MSESIERKLGPWGTIVSAILLIIAFIADVSGLFVNHKSLVETVMLISAIILAGFAFYLLKLLNKYSERTKEYEKLKKDNSELRVIAEAQRETEKSLKECRESLKNEQQRIQSLETIVCDGKKFLDNKAIITFDVPEKKYKLAFEKRYKILTDATKWYEGQFYSNVSLESAKKSQDFYKEHEVKWDTLKVSAELKYKNIDDASFSETKQLSILRVAEGNNYKKYHIQYKTKNGYNLDIKKDAEIVLNYSYEVPVHLWGSYLNRSISYWSEPATVVIKGIDKSMMIDDYFSVFETNSITGKKVICDKVKTTKESKFGVHEMTFILPKKGPAHYSVWWNAEKIFGIEGINTYMTEDHSQLTDY